MVHKHNFTRNILPKILILQENVEIANTYDKEKLTDRYMDGRFAAGKRCLVTV